MKKGILILAVLLIFLAGAYYFIRNKVGDIVPAILPPKLINDVIQTDNKTSPNIGEKPALPLSLPSGFAIGIFAKNLDGARDLEFAPNGTLLVSLTSAGKIVAISDTDDDGIGDKIKDVVIGLNRPHGLAFDNGKLYMAEETAVSRYDWDEKNWELTNKKLLFPLPAGGRHFTRSLVFDKTGKLFISVGSTCDVCVEKNPIHGTILVSDKVGAPPRIFAKGLRNSVFVALNPTTEEVWATEMGRDWLGDNIPPDEINIISEEGDYGWPYCYGSQVYDKNFGRENPSYCPKTELPIYEILAHSAPLGLTFINSKQFPEDWQGDLLVAYHGSWNRSTPSGYKVVHMKVKDNQILGEEDFLTGFLSGSQALARPVDLVFDKAGSLYISDDKAGYVFKVVK